VAQRRVCVADRSWSSASSRCRAAAPRRGLLDELGKARRRSPSLPPARAASRAMPRAPARRPPGAGRTAVARARSGCSSSRWICAAWASARALPRGPAPRRPAPPGPRGAPGRRPSPLRRSAEAGHRLEALGGELLRCDRFRLCRGRHWSLVPSTRRSLASTHSKTIAGAARAATRAARGPARNRSEGSALQPRCLRYTPSPHTAPRPESARCVPTRVRPRNRAGEAQAGEHSRPPPLEAPSGPSGLGAAAGEIASSCPAWRRPEPWSQPSVAALAAGRHGGLPPLRLSPLSGRPLRYSANARGSTATRTGGASAWCAPQPACRLPPRSSVTPEKLRVRGRHLPGLQGRTTDTHPDSPSSQSKLKLSASS
jgi:hypothetical protein